ncbi:hypothetical protein Cfla_0582 [Cellulomonas flavigena DSM 20109]|uniref:DUF3806 domain-containing protein n=1 Tax=Cellulomonas flavigena (strain ATCC 482 / DSM 20109 / BCRC 11376 / JCM 18109 / NBRC 3775 / NCIMB 8073 / NRS 134) TaxID=446466 RepID=D5UIJ5_CELFN|nr:hypothetical protein [Cellulomonas flavigena]ADG73494.1 hypothetical protein Cfla_0582 [Cellulomonas flavigena DSM 20109]
MDTHSPALAARSAAPTGAAFARPMTPDEAAHLDRLREWLHGDGTDASDAAALDARWARLLATHPPQAPAPAGVAAAIGIAVGDLLVASVTDAVWRMCPGPEGATPGVLLPERPQMPVLPVLDAHARWRVRSPEWTVDYVERAAAHLRRLRPTVPTPHPAPEAVTAVEPTDAPVNAPVDDVVPVERTIPEPAAWAPTFVEDATEPEHQPEPAAAWTPTFVEIATEPEHQPEPAAAWTPTFVETATEPEHQPEPAATWTPTFVETATEPEHQPEPAATWTPTFVETATEPEPEQAAWTPTLVEDVPEPEPAWTPAPVASAEPDVEASFDALAAPLTGAVAAVAEPVAEEPSAPETSVMPWDVAPAAVAYPTPGRGMPVVPEHTLTPEDLPHRPSERVQDLALRALELALDRAVRDAAGCAPFVLVREDHDVEVHDFPHSDAGVAQARAAARDGGYGAAAVAWTSPADASRPYPRVVVDASAAGRPGIRVAHSFLHDAEGGHEIGGPQVVGQSAPVL